jgi:hypothetical protein
MDAGDGWLCDSLAAGYLELVCLAQDNAILAASTLRR